MPDISMCRNETCPRKEECFRFRAVPDHFQSFADFAWFECSNFWSLENATGPIRDA